MSNSLTEEQIIVLKAMCKSGDDADGMMVEEILNNIDKDDSITHNLIRKMLVDDIGNPLTMRFENGKFTHYQFIKNYHNKSIHSNIRKF